MIVYADTGKASVEHLEFNLSMIETLSQIANVVAALGPGQKKIAADSFPGVEIIPLEILVDPRGKLAFFKKLLYEIFAILHVVRFARANSAPVVFGYVFPMAQWFVHFAALMYGVKVALLLHGEVSSLSKKGWKSWLGSKPWVLLNVALCRFKIIKCFVLEERIANNLKLIGVEMNWIDLPYRFPIGDDSDLFVQRIEGQPLNFVFGGTLSVERGLLSLIELSSRLKDLILSGKVRIQHVGVQRGVSADQRDILISNGVSLRDVVGKGFLSPQEFDAGLREADFLLIFVDPEPYRYICSAAFLDSLKLGIPFIAFQTPLVEKLFDDNKRPGLIYHSVEEMADAIRALGTQVATPLSQFYGLRSLRAQCAIGSVAKQWCERFFDK